MIRKFIWATVFLFAAIGGNSQNEQSIQIAKQYILSNSTDWHLLPEDVSDLHLQDAYTDAQTGNTYLYFIQRHEGVEIYNAIFNIVLDENNLPIHFGNRLYTNLAEKVMVAKNKISPEGAIWATARQLNIAAKASKMDLKQEKQVSQHEFIFNADNISNSSIPVKLCYQKLPSGKLALAWSLAVDMLDSDDYWGIRVDAESGDIIDKNNFTVYCSFDKNQNRYCTAHGTKHISKEIKKVETAAPAIQAAGTYRVFPLPLESPNHGAQMLVTDPHDLTASPFGWHDTDGTDGAEFTITRGNNAHAYLDVNNLNQSNQDEPDGGADLIFDYEYASDKEPNEQQPAAVTNLFYMTNMMHDFSYRYGFTEAAGNFQYNNYDKGGSGEDFVEAQAQDGGDENNANFSTFSDGAPGRMQMYLWSGGELLNVEEPADIAGWYHTGSALYGPRVTPSTNISGELVLAQDSVFNASGHDGCEPFKNTDIVAGKIAVVDRGGCYYKEKSLNAEAAGALALIMCNFNETANDLGGTNQVPGNPTIPTISLGNGDCQLLKDFLQQGVKVSIKQRSGGIQLTDASFDNGIIAHEYAHGISNRLTAGRFNTGCLSNAEQAGEGWSDFFALAVTAIETDRDRPRGIGTYSRKETVDGRGLRPYLYSTDMTENPATYADIAQFSVPHGVGFVWASMLWDLYWAMSDEYGFDDDFINGTGGNNMAIQLVMEGLKIQPCQPGFVDSRDAILAADDLLFNGENQCLIREVFARRGLGFFAEQGNNDIVGDEKLSFEPMQTCIQELKISKTGDPIANAGDEIEIELKISNHKTEAATGVTVTDELPEGLSFLNIVNTQGIAQFDISTRTEVPGFVSFEVKKDLAAGEEISITYKAQTSPDKYSLRMYFDQVPDGSNDTWNRWLAAIEANQDNNDVDNIWELTDRGGVSDDWAWSVDDHKLETIQSLYSSEPFRITGKNPTIRFFHKYNTYPGQHGGVFEISDDGGTSYRNHKNLFFRNGYPGLISYQSFVIPNFFAFSGKAQSYHASYIDMNDFKDEELHFRFRLGTRNVNDFEGVSFLDYFLSDNGGSGWQIDNFEIMDLFNYDGEACVSSNEGDHACANAPERGTIIESEIPVATHDLGNNSNVAVYPNPASETIHFAFESAKNQNAHLRIFDLSGKIMQQQTLQILADKQVLALNIEHLPFGIYFVNIQSDQESITEKIVVE